MTQAQQTDQGARQMTDEEIAAEQARSRSVGLVLVLTVAMFSGYVLTQYFALQEAAGGNTADYLTAIQNNKLLFILSGFFFSVGSLLVALPLTHILTAARARFSRIPRVPMYLAIAGPVAISLVYPVFTLGMISAAADFAASEGGGVKLAVDLRDSTLISVSELTWQIGQAMLAVALIFTGMYAMRIGLLTRMMGAFAIAIGVVSIWATPFAGLLLVFWMGALAIMLLGESAQVPPAWKLGRPVPWREVDAMRREVGKEEDPQELGKPEGE